MFLRGEFGWMFTYAAKLIQMSIDRGLIAT